MIWTKCRTLFINNRIESWISKIKGKKQVLNLGAGLDGRAFWLDCLKNIETFIEVDEIAVITFKDEKILEAQE